MILRDHLEKSEVSNKFDLILYSDLLSDSGKLGGTEEIKRVVRYVHQTGKGQTTQYIHQVVRSSLFHPRTFSLSPKEVPHLLSHFPSPPPYPPHNTPNKL